MATSGYRMFSAPTARPVSELNARQPTFVEAFDAPDAPALDPATVARIREDAWPSARIVFHPSVQRLDLGYAAHDLRLAVRRGEAPSRPEPAPCFVVVFRGPELLQCLDVAHDAFALMGELARGVPLGEACERVVGMGASGEAHVGAWFQQWTALRLIARVDVA